MKTFDSGRFRYAVVALALVAAGCTDSTEPPPLPRIAVSGTVMLDGKPLPEGRLQFIPDQSSSGIITVGEIQDGRFSIDRANGPIPGKYRVAVSSRPVFKLKSGDDPGGSPPPSGPEKVPGRYTGKSSELVVDISANGPNTCEFNLSSKKP
ncbi:MAG: hypothetical protein ACLQGP_41410 [Isosphaeraceae bacterium]